MRNWLRVTICIMLIVSVLAMSLSVFAVEPSPQPSLLPQFDETGELRADVMSYYIWTCLNAWGIALSFNGEGNFFDYVGDQIVTWVIEYLEGLPSIYSINEWIAPWQGSYDYWGNLRLNNSALEDIQDFSNWLIDKLNLSDNQAVVINEQYMLGDYPLYQFGNFYQAERVNGPPSSYVAVMCDDENQSSMLGWTIVEITDSDTAKFQLLVVSTSTESPVILYFTRMLNDGTLNGPLAWGPVGAVRSNNNGWYFQVYSYPYYWPLEGQQAFIPTGGHYTGTSQEVELFCTNFDIAVENGMYVLTEQIQLPEYDTSFQSGDSITIIDGKPQYSNIPWPDSVSVDNLPAVVSTGTIENPHLEEAYRPIQGLITYAKDGVEVCTALLYELPDEMVYMWYGLIASLIIWGMIKLMREH